MNFGIILIEISSVVSQIDDNEWVPILVRFGIDTILIYYILLQINELTNMIPIGEKSNNYNNQLNDVRRISKGYTLRKTINRD